MTKEEWGTLLPGDVVCSANEVAEKLFLKTNKYIIRKPEYKNSEFYTWYGLNQDTGREIMLRHDHEYWHVVSKVERPTITTKSNRIDCIDD